MAIPNPIHNIVLKFTPNKFIEKFRTEKKNNNVRLNWRQMAEIDGEYEKPLFNDLLEISVAKTHCTVTYVNANNNGVQYYLEICGLRLGVAT